MIQNENIYKYLTEHGAGFFRKWGDKLHGLRNGSIKPALPNEEKFVQTFKAGSVASGQAEIFWFKIEEIEALEYRCKQLELESEEYEARISSLEQGIKNQNIKIIEPLKKEIEYLNGIVKNCQGKISNYEMQLRISDVAVSSKPGDICPVCKGSGAMGNCRKCEGKGWL